MKLKNILAGTTLALAVAGVVGVVGASAQINSPVPSNAYIKFDGLDWAWGGPCPYSGGCYATGSLAYQGTLGWSLPTEADMALVDAYDAVNPSAFADLFLDNPGGNVPAGGVDPVSGAFWAEGYSATAGSCATPYFNNTNTPWCDDINGEQGDWAGSTNADSYAEQLYVKDAVPEASTWALMLGGFGGLGAVMRSRRNQRAVSLTA